MKEVSGYFRIFEDRGVKRMALSIRHGDHMMGKIVPMVSE